MVKAPGMGIFDKLRYLTENEIDEFAFKMSQKIAQETESLIARFIIETGTPASQIELCYGPGNYNEPGVTRIWVRTKATLPETSLPD
jgi:hypothetical protein